jgi:hypothetical protein
LPLENLDEDLECCLHHVSLILPSYFHVIVPALIDCSISQVLALSEEQHAKRAAESVHVAKIAVLEVLVRSQAEKIARLVTPTFYKNKNFVQIGVHIKMHIKL